MSQASLTYALVTPVRNEKENLARLAASIECQTVSPAEWVIVDTGSTDSTADIAEGLARNLPFVRVRSIAGSALPARGGPIVRGFMTGAEALEQEPDVIVKLDADLSFGCDYFERLLAGFAADPRLGLASGICTELRNGEWRPLYGTRSHVWGASRAYRWSCFQQVLPLEERRGWDEIDSIKAQIRGWHVATLGDLPFRHHRPEGIRDGSSWERWTRLGRAARYMGYRFSYLLVRAVWRALRDPRALGMVGGYLAASLAREERCPDAAVRARLRKEQSMRRLPLRLREALGRVV